MIKNKKAEGITSILIIIVIALFFGWLINVSQRECRTNKNCSSESYCGSDFSCHQYPTIQKTVVQYSLFWPAVVIGIAVIIAAFIFRRERIVPEKTIIERKIENVVEEPEEVEDISEPYYKSDSNIKTP